MKKEDYDIFNLITTMHLGVEWIFKSEILYKNSDKNFCEVFKNFKESNGLNNDFNLFDSGILLSYVYITFLLPKESIFKNFNMRKIDNSSFNIIYNTYKDDNIPRHLRNALSHGNIEVSENSKFVFYDVNPQNKNEKFKADISFVNLGEYTSAFYNKFKSEYFDKTNKQYTVSK